MGITSYINSLLEKGIDLPLPKNITKHIKNQKVTTYEGYLLIDGEPDFDNL